MKFINKILFITLIGAGIGLSAVAQDDGMRMNKQHMMTMMEDSSMQVMMMDHIASNPQMRSMMMQKMMTMRQDSSDLPMMQKMMNNPQMRDRMKRHVEMMQSILDGNMDRSQMMGMMKDNSGMMNMYMRCMSMMSNADSTGNHRMNHNGHHKE